MFEIPAPQKEELAKIDSILRPILAKEYSMWRVVKDSIEPPSVLEALEGSMKEIPNEQKIIGQLSEFSKLSLSLAFLEYEYRLDGEKIKQPKSNDLIIYYALLTGLALMMPQLNLWLYFTLGMMLLLIIIKVIKTLKFRQQSAVLEKTIFLIKQAQDKAKVK